MNIVEHMPLWYGGTSFGYMLRSHIARSSGKTISSFLRNQQIDFQSGYRGVPSHQHGSSVPLSSYPCQHTLWLELLTLAILSGLRWNLRLSDFHFSDD